MENRNTSDRIENYLKELLESSNAIEIRRRDMASQFNVVPSQINYVINTRFTLPKGYTVESKRGGGGYIRIVKVQVSDDHQLLTAMSQIVGNSLDNEDAKALLQKLYEEDVLTKREGNLLLSLFMSDLLDEQASTEEVNRLRARMMKVLLERLDYES